MNRQRQTLGRPQKNCEKHRYEIENTIVFKYKRFTFYAKLYNAQRPQPFKDTTSFQTIFTSKHKKGLNNVSEIDQLLLATVIIHTIVVVVDPNIARCSYCESFNFLGDQTTQCH
jgi:hypothetical protein